MDKVKAIKVLKPLVDSYVDYANISMKEEDDDIVDALEMAVEALKALDVSNTNVGDMISRQAAINAVKKNTFRLTFAEEQNCEGHVAWSAYAVYSDVMEGALLELPSAQPEQKWIPCSERLPEEDVEVLIAYRYKEGEGDTSHTNIDITTYGQMYFGGNKVGNHKHWRSPFKYFESNYEVVAWLPLPEQYKGNKNE